MTRVDDALGAGRLCRIDRVAVTAQRDLTDRRRGDDQDVGHALERGRERRRIIEVTLTDADAPIGPGLRFGWLANAEPDRVRRDASEQAFDHEMSESSVSAGDDQHSSFLVSGDINHCLPQIINALTPICYHWKHGRTADPDCRGGEQAARKGRPRRGHDPRGRRRSARASADDLSAVRRQARPARRRGRARDRDVSPIRRPTTNRSPIRSKICDAAGTSTWSSV